MAKKEISFSAIILQNRCSFPVLSASIPNKQKDFSHAHAACMNAEKYLKKKKKTKWQNVYASMNAEKIAST